MANSYHIIDEKTWERAMNCMVFRNSVEPAFCITFEADIQILSTWFDTAFTYLNKDTGLFKVVNVPMVNDLKEYL